MLLRHSPSSSGPRSVPFPLLPSAWEQRGEPREGSCQTLRTALQPGRSLETSQPEIRGHEAAVPNALAMTL